MQIILFSKPGCGKCKAAKDKLQRLGLNYESRNLADYITLHDNWRIDGSVELMAWYAEHQDMPVIMIDGTCCGYGEAMKILKGMVA